MTKCSEDCDDEDSGGDGDHGGPPLVVIVMIMVIMKTVLIMMAMLRMIWKAQMTNHLAKVLCSDNVDDHGDEDENKNKTKRQKYKGTTANLCCNPKNA